MKYLHYYFIFFLATVITSACSSNDSDNQITVFNILVLDSGSLVPIQGAKVEICNNPYFCTNVLTSGTTNTNGKIKLSLTASDMLIAESFTVFKDDYKNLTVFFEHLEDLSKEIIVHMKKYETAD